MATTIFGCVNADGTILSGSTGSDGQYNFDVDKTGEGIYEVTYDSAFHSVPAVVLTQNHRAWSDFSYGGGYLTDNCVLIASDRYHCKVLTGAGQQHQDRNFTLIAMGS